MFKRLYFVLYNSKMGSNSHQFFSQTVDLSVDLSAASAAEEY